MLIVDARQNIAFNAQQLSRDYARWAWLTRRDERNQPLPPAATSLPDNLLAGVGIVFGSLLVIPSSWPARAAWQKLSYRSSEEARQLASWQLDYYRRLEDEQEQIRLIQTQADLDAVSASWRPGAPRARRMQGIVALMQGADPLDDPKQLEDWHAQGIRILALAAAPTPEAGLSMRDYELLEAMADVNMALDPSGLSEGALNAALDNFAGPVIASHGNPRRFCQGGRGLSDAAIQSIAERDGALGIMLYNGCLRRDWHASDPKRRVTLSHWVDAVDYVCQITGSAAHVGLGSDIDRGYAYHELPAEIDTSSDFWLLEERLRERGFSQDDVAAILRGNMLRKLRETLPEG